MIPGEMEDPGAMVDPALLHFELDVFATERTIKPDGCIGILAIEGLLGHLGPHLFRKTKFDLI